MLSPIFTRSGRGQGHHFLPQLSSHYTILCSLCQQNFSRTTLSTLFLFLFSHSFLNLHNFTIWCGRNCQCHTCAKSPSSPLTYLPVSEHVDPILLETLYLMILWFFVFSLPGMMLCSWFVSSIMTFHNFFSLLLTAE